MKDEQIEKEIKEKFMDDHGKIKQCYHPKSYIHYNYIIQKFSDSSSFSESIYRICKNIEIRPVCPVCGGYIKYGKHNFSKHCSYKCSANDRATREKCRQTCNKNMEQIMLHRHLKLKVK